MAVGDNDLLQMLLAHEPGFLNRVQYWAVKKARDVRMEGNVTNHAERNAFAALVLGNPGLLAAQIAVGLVTHINLTARDTTYNPQSKEWETSATGAEIFSAVGDMWNTYAGV